MLHNTIFYYFLQTKIHISAYVVCIISTSLFVKAVTKTIPTSLNVYSFSFFSIIFNSQQSIATFLGKLF